MAIIISLVVSFLVTAILGHYLIPALRRLKAGQSIKEIGPTWHMSKQGTPTMGGLMFIGGIIVATVIVGWPYMMQGQFTHLLVLAFALVFGVIGFLDDYEKVKHHQNTGLTAAQKFLLQLAASIVFIILLRASGFLTPNLYIPFLNVELVLPWPVYMVFAAFVMVGTVNAVNITDGIDGLATGVTLPVAVFYMAVSMWYGYTHLGVFAAALAVSSQWDGEMAALVRARTPLRLFTGRDDSYYGSDSFVQTASELRSLYTGDGLSEGEIDKLVVLDVKEADYFTQRGFSDQHAGGGAAATDAEVMEWLFSKR